MNAALIVIAKAPVPGRVKTRLCPPCTPVQAAALAEAALRDTLDAVLATPAGRHALVLDGAPPAWLPGDLEVLHQRGDGLAERLGDAFAQVGGPALLVGMDTPQVTPALLADGLAALGRAPAVLGPASDGGYWAVGLRRADADVFTGVPMSVPDTLEHQRARLRRLDLATVDLPTLRDVDDIAAATDVARQCAEGSRFAAAVQALGTQLAGAAA